MDSLFRANTWILDDCSYMCWIPLSSKSVWITIAVKTKWWEWSGQIFSSNSSLLPWVPSELRIRNDWAAARCEQRQYWNYLERMGSGKLAELTELASLEQQVGNCDGICLTNSKEVFVLLLPSLPVPHLSHYKPKRIKPEDQETIRCVWWRTLGNQSCCLCCQRFGLEMHKQWRRLAAKLFGEI